MIVVMFDLILNGGTLLLFLFYFMRKIWIKEFVSYIKLTIVNPYNSNGLLNSYNSYRLSISMSYTDL